jgi:RimJ/RimL family protein N-acetyltransferase
MRRYKVLKQQVFQEGDFSIIPIRMEDRYSIMQWRNEQIYHLRQAEPLTKEKQNWYFDNIVGQLFDQEKPSQILFSFLKNGECIGYGGLVHINWIDKNAEISFIMQTDLQEESFEENWVMFLTLIEEVAFKNLAFHKVFTFAFDVRPHLYVALDTANFKKEAVLAEHCFVDGGFKDVVIHSKIRKEVELRPATQGDCEVTFQWANNAEVRRYALTQNEILKVDHINWFSEKIEDPNCIYLIASYNKSVIGSFRIDNNEEKIGYISYLLDPIYHGKGLGQLLLREGIKRVKSDNILEMLIGIVKEENMASAHLFRKLGFQENSIGKGLLKFQLKLK